MAVNGPRAKEDKDYFTAMISRQRAITIIILHSRLS